MRFSDGMVPGFDHCELGDLPSDARGALNRLAQQTGSGKTAPP